MNEEGSICSSSPGADKEVADKLTDKNQERNTLGRKENQAVSRLRVVVFLVLLVTATLVSVGVYLYIANDQEEDFEHDFRAQATKILESFHESVERKLEAVDALSVAFTSYARGTGVTFPNVTLPDFEIRAANARILADSFVINYYPLVTDETRKGWEEYQIANRDYYDASMQSGSAQRAYQAARFGEDDRRSLVEEVLTDEIEDLTLQGARIVAPEGSGPYLPLWQMSPAVPMKSILNFNVLSHPAGAGSYTEVLNSGEAVMDAAANLNQENFGATGAYIKLLISMSQYRNSMDLFLGDPTSSLGYPVFDSFDRETRSVVGVIATTLYWRQYFEDVLPANARGILCVIENTHNQTFTYRVDGSNTTYLGFGDFHDSKYDHLAISVNVNTYIEKKASIQTSSYTSVDLNGDYCGYTLRVYPSQDTENEFVNSSPIIFTVVVACIFLFTSMVFVLYDYLVARRQSIVMNRAVASSAIVSSLFPSQVRDKLYKENEDQKEKKWKSSGNEGGVLGAFLNIAGGGDIVKSSKPIADLFQNTTILFADLAGFTAWSSTRQPEQVFVLLEVSTKLCCHIPLTSLRTH
jgi:hypothetical protein